MEERSIRLILTTPSALMGSPPLEYPSVDVAASPSITITCSPATNSYEGELTLFNCLEVGGDVACLGVLVTPW